MTSHCLDSKEVQCPTWRMHTYDQSCQWITQYGFFCHFAGPVAPTGIAIVYWVGCIKAIKCCLSQKAQGAMIREIKGLFSIMAQLNLDVGITISYGLFSHFKAIEPIKRNI